MDAGGIAASWWRGGLARGGRRTVVAAVAVLVAAGAGAPGALALSPPHIFWANEGGSTIGEANLDGTGATESLIPGASSPSGVAVDAQHLYWANSGSIGEANLDGTDPKQSFISGASTPIAVAVNGQHIYWTNASTGSIGEANLDGSDPNQSFITGAIFPSGLAVDAQHIYWANAQGNTIGEANLDGTGVNQHFITGASGPTGVAVNGQHIYWTNFDASTIGEANLDGTGVNQSFITGATDPLGVAVSVPIASVSPASPPAFATTPQGTLSAPQTLTVSNTGQVDLTISGLSFSGADPGDFVIGSNSCLGSIAPGESCQLQVSFAPGGQGARSATLLIASNDNANSPLSVPLSGTGGNLPQGPQGLQGSQGPPGTMGTQGPTGAQGPAGPAGKVELVSCTTVTKNVKGHRRKVKQCTTKLVSGTVTFTTTAGDPQATLSRGPVVYGTGARVGLGQGRFGLLLVAKRRLTPGHYVLTQRTRQGQRWITTRSQIQIR
jgi:virginiamycin B lyase